MISIVINIVSWIYLVLVMFFYFSKGRIKNIENKIYQNMTLSIFIGMICDFTTGLICYSNSVLFKSTIHIFIIKLLFISYLIWDLLLIDYVSTITRKDKKNGQKNIMSKIIKPLIIILSLVFIIFPIRFIEDSLVPKGIAVDIISIVTIFLIIYIPIKLIKNIKIIIDKKYLPLFLYLFLGILTIIIQTYTGLLLMSFIDCFVTVLMFFTIENPDVKMIEQLNIAKDQADKANRAKTDFLSSMSHEIRTPLNAIVGFSNSLNENEKLPEELKSDVKDILTASDNLLEIVNGVLDISKIEANKIEIIKKEYDTKKMFEELSKLTKVRIGEKPIEFIVKFDESMPRVLYGDLTRVKQVILNILTNAAKYTDKGKIIFTTESIIKDGICRMIVSVEDTGRGIKRESIDKLFTKFERLDEDRNTTIEGTGLGLAITKKLLELMHGKIVVQSEYGKGSKFTIVLDQKIVEKPTISLDEDDNINKETLDLTDKKVLVVDDNKLNIKVATRLLTPYNLTIESCESGFDAITKLKENSSYDLILMDDMMPKMSGTETLQKIKEEKLYDGPVIALTANALTGMKEKYIESGFNDYLAKPIEKTELNRVLKKYLKK